MTQSFLSLVDQVAAGPQVVAMVVVVVVEIMAEETLEVHQVNSQFLVQLKKTKIKNMIRYLFHIPPLQVTPAR